MKLLISFCLLLVIVSCKKNSKQQCPPTFYNVSCQESYPDFEFGGYGTNTSTYVIESNCLEDAIKKAQEMSYGYGQIYKHCQVMR